MQRIDDFIQGIMFSRTTFVDVRRITKQERNAFRSAVRLHTTRNFSETQATLAKPGDMVRPDISNNLRKH